MFITTALRNIRRNFSYTFLNVFGLGLGVATCLVIFLVVRNELSYDNYHKKADRTYRVTLNAIDFNPSVSMAIAPAMRSDFPELEISQSWFRYGGMVKIGEHRYNEKGYFFADQQFTSIFDFQWMAGNARTALTAPNTVVLTESMAKKYFGKENAMGQVIRLDNAYDLKVTGIIKDQPANTHIPFLFLVSFETLAKELEPAGMNFYAIMGGTTYIVVPEHYDVDQLRKRIPSFIKSHWGNDIAKDARLPLQPMLDIHYDTRYLGGGASPTVSKNSYKALGAIGLLIIIIAAINFINLSTAQSIKRAKEVGVRKVLGADRRQLIRQFLGETSVLVLVAVVLGTLAASLFLSKATDWLEINIGPAALADPVVMLFIGGLTLLLILLAGVYPAFVQSAFNPISAFKNMRAPVVRGFSLRKSLVVVQFVISQLLIIGTLVVAWQMDFFRNQDLGFNKEAVVSFPLPDRSKREIIRQQLAADPGVKEMSFSSGAPGYSNNFAPFSAPDRGLDKDDVTELKFIDEHYTTMFGIKLLAGAGLVPLQGVDTLNQVLVNETLIHKLGIQNPQEAIGARFKGVGRTLTIKGVVQDFQSESKHKLRRPVILRYNADRLYDVSVKLQSGNMVKTMARIDKMWSTMFPEELFEYEFLDDHIANFYRQEQKLYTAFRLFAGIAILIGCLGLYGLIAFAAIQRTKEVGIRKVLGASMTSIVYLFSKEFIWLIVIAFCIAAPIAYYMMDNWLQNFAYHISIGVGVFLLAIAASFIIAGLTIATQTIKAAVANPVKALRSE
ncbi:ABC transporter permease [Paraflavitalea soli]|uniref:ABC transporter permease n=1 Tax=Paraflavitalea soli TaxID=2315862 RepID=A0A3B7MLV2_9BACT|nr:ABC transporter permease [Paraflavitalea soli]AXY75494.1 ABC transporter permease [Paraflavitalea soli]